MKNYLIFLILVVLSFTSQASNLINNPNIKEQENCFHLAFSNYDSWRNLMEKVISKKVKSELELEQRLVKFDSNFGKEKFNFYKNKLSCSTFKYLVDGNSVNGFVIKPKSSKSKLPVLIYNRGGNGNFGGVVFGSMMNNLFPIANEGFVIIGSQYRGTFTNNSSAHDEFGGKDVNDVIALLDYIPSIAGADPQRIGMYGASRGGMQTHLALKQAHGIKAIATIAGATDLLKELSFRPAMEKVYMKRIPDYYKNKVSELEGRSVIKWVKSLPTNIPILLLHGEADKRVSVESSIELANALTQNGIPHKLVIYPDDNHGLLKNKEEANRELVSWFQEHL